MSAISRWGSLDSVRLKDDNIKHAWLLDVGMIKGRRKMQGTLDGVPFAVEMWKCLQEKLRLSAEEVHPIFRIDNLLVTMEEAISTLDVAQAADTEKCKSNLEFYKVHLESVSCRLLVKSMLLRCHLSHSMLRVK
jgi:hypothetical protein